MLLANTDQISPPVHLHELLTDWQFTDALSLIAFVIQLLAIAWYVGAVLRLRRRDRRWSKWRTAAFISGVAVLMVAIVSGLASDDDKVFVVHVAQHLFLMMVAPPLLAMGAPVTLAIQAAKRPMQERIVRVLHNPVVRVVTTPLLGAIAYYVSMYVIFLSSFYPFSLHHPLVHELSHLVMFLLGCIFWWPIVAVDQLPRRPSYPLRLFALFLGMPFEVFLGVAMLSYGHPIAPQHSLSDTRAGGGIFWAASMLVTFGAAMIVLAQWMNQEERKARRQDLRDDESGLGAPGGLARPLRSAAREAGTRTDAPS